MLTVKIPQYDFGYNEQFTIYTDGRHLNVKDITGFTAWLLVWTDDNENEPYIMKEIEVSEDGTSGIVYWNVTSDDTAQFGNYKAEIRLIKSHLEPNGQGGFITINDIVYSTMQFVLQIVPSWQIPIEENV